MTGVPDPRHSVLPQGTGSPCQQKFRSLSGRDRAFHARRLATFLLALLAGETTGCHKKRVVSPQSTPSPPATRQAPTSSRTLPRPVLPPLSPGNDNARSSGRQHSVETGLASWYAPTGRRSANGEVYDGTAFTAAHRTLPLGTVLHVTNLTTGLAATVTVTDRGPFVSGRVLDLSITAAKSVGVYRMGVAQVRMEVVEPGPDVALPGRWCVQIGPFKDEGRAVDLKAELQQRYGTVARTIQFTGSTGYWVRLNPVDGDLNRASDVAQSLKPKETGAQAWLVRLD